MGHRLSALLVRDTTRMVPPGRRTVDQDAVRLGELTRGKAGRALVRPAGRHLTANALETTDQGLPRSASRTQSQSGILLGRRLLLARDFSSNSQRPLANRELLLM